VENRWRKSNNEFLEAQRRFQPNVLYSSNVQSQDQYCYLSVLVRMPLRGIAGGKKEVCQYKFDVES
jgi:hypothetical protein